MLWRHISLLCRRAVHLITENQLMWKVKTKVIPVIIRTRGKISESLAQYQRIIAGKHKIRNYKKQQYWALHAYYEKF